jgi:hypothetical protein
MKSIIPKEVIGKFFGFRNAIVGISAFSFLLLFGTMLNLFEANISIIFMGIFLIGASGRFIGTLIFFKISEPRTNFKFEKKTRFIGFVKNLRKDKFGYFVLYGSLMTFGISLTGPFIGYHYLENIGLKENYFLYTILISTAMITSIIGMNYWGKIVNQFGTIKTLKATSILIILFPALYIIIRNPIGLIGVQFIDGLIFSGYALAMATFVFDYSSQKKIIRFGTYQAIFFGTAVFLGAIISGLIQTININFFIINNSFYLVCIISIIIRFSVFKILFKKVKEVKQVEYIKTTKLVYSIITFEPVTKMVPKTVFFDNEIKRINISFEKKILYLNKIINYTSKKMLKYSNKNLKKNKQKIKKSN